MRKKSYSSYYKTEEPVREDEFVEKTVEQAVVETVLVSEDKEEEPASEINEEKESTATTYVSPSVVGVPKKGRVANCERVNVRTAPEPDSPIATIILFGEEVDVDPSKSTEKYYAVTTNMNIDGFIKKDFVEV